jgi:hypothetical protein
VKKRRITHKKDEAGISTSITNIIDEEERNILDI